MSVCAALGFMTAAPMNLLQKQGDYEAVIPMDFKPNPVNYPEATPKAPTQPQTVHWLTKLGNQLGLEAASDAMDYGRKEEDGGDEDEADQDDEDEDEGEDEDSTDVDENEDNQVGNFEAVAPMDFLKETYTKKSLIKKLKAIINKTPNKSDALKAIIEVIDRASYTTNTSTKNKKKTIKKSTKPKKTKKNKKTKETDASK